MLLLDTDLCFLLEGHKTEYKLMFLWLHDPKEGKQMPPLADPLLLLYSLSTCNFALSDSA